MHSKLIFPMLFATMSLTSCVGDHEAMSETQPPNIVIIYADDLGFGEVGAQTQTSPTRALTPNLDQLVSRGTNFQFGYASSATCSPSRYALLTGRYPWRNKRAKILPGTAPLLIDTAENTIPSMLKTRGYATGIVGKWHLGLGSGKVNWNSHISPGPNEVGFDYSYIMAATQDRVPTVYIENGYVVRGEVDDPIEIDYQNNFDDQPTGKSHRSELRMNWHHGHNSSIVNGIPRIGFMKGGSKARWIDENMADTFLVRAQEFLREYRDTSFFLFYTLQQPHVPRTPHPRFVGSSGMGPRGDVIVEADWCVGELLKTLDELGLTDETLVIFSSDNGPVLNDGYFDDAVERIGQHDPAGSLRGGKYSLFEAGTRVPFIVAGPDVAKGVTSTAIVSQIDLFSSLGELVGSAMKGPDSKSMLEVFRGKSEAGREDLVLEATTRTAFRKGDWVLIPPYPGPPINKNVNIELGNSATPLLFNLADDPSQQKSLAESHPDKLAEMWSEFKSVRGSSAESIEQLELR